MSNGHAQLAPSSAERWMNCPGSVALCAQVPRRPTSIHAAEGTVAHKLAEQYVTNEVDTLELNAMLGTVIKEAGHEIEVIEEMIDGAMEYRDLINADRALLELDERPSPVHGKSEFRVKMSEIDPRIWGTCDYALYRKGHKLIVYDYKFGKGHVVEPEENPQAALYVLGVMETIGCRVFDEVEIVIHQPRAAHIEGPVRRWKVSTEWLTEFKDRCVLAAAETIKIDAKIEAGPWCRWCDARATCPTMTAAAADNARAAFDQPPPAAGSKKELVANALPDARALSVAKLARILEWEDTINSWLEAVKDVVREKLSNGEEVPGFKLVDGRSNRKWIDEERVEQEYGAVLGDKLFEPKKMLSPAKLEKVVGKKKLDHLTFKPPAKKAVAKEKDPRPVARSSAQDAFDRIDDYPHRPISKADTIWPR